MYHPRHPASAPELILALQRLIDAVIDGGVHREPTSALDTLYAAINYLAASEQLCPCCGRALIGAHRDLCPGQAAALNRS